MHLTSSAFRPARRVVIALSLLHALFGMSLALRSSGPPIGIVHASVGYAPGWMLFVDLRATNTHPWPFFDVPPSTSEPPNAVQLNVWTVDLKHASFVQYVTVELPLARALYLLIAWHIISALTLLALALKTRWH
jgi:hypothetical protein